MEEMKNKGTLFYTMVGIMVIILVLAVALHMLKSTYDPKAADIDRLSRFSDALYSLESCLEQEAKQAEYPVIWAIGHNVTKKGINLYLSIPNGREKLKKDLLKGFTRNLNTRLASISSVDSAGHYAIRINDVVFTLTEIEEDDVVINETSDGLRISFWTHINSTHGGYVYDHDMLVTSGVPARIFQMYDKAKTFHESYVEDVQWASTTGLYMRAYVNAYNSKYKGSFLREGHLAYDPLEPFMTGDPYALRNFSLASIGDAGTVPLATSLSEWRYLSEPSFLPPGADLDLGLSGTAQILQSIKDNYDVTKAADCGSLSGQEKTECESFNDPARIREKAEDLTEQRIYLQDLSSRINAFTPTASWTCDEFRESADTLITLVSEGFDGLRAKEDILDPALSYADETILETEVAKNLLELFALNSSISRLLFIQENRLPVLREGLCKLPAVMDCVCVDGPESCSGSSCTECDDPSCNRIKCPAAGFDYICESYEAGGRRSEEVECEKETCREVCSEESCSEECTTSEFNRTLRIDLCNCQCHPKTRIISDVEKELDYIRAEIDERVKSLIMQENELILRALALEEARIVLDELERLRAEEFGYDVYARFDFSKVSYYPVLNTQRCYLEPDWNYRLYGTCGNRDESVGLYTAQVSAAVLCCSLAPACCPAVDYAVRWFPAVYQVEGYYSISETLIDDRNRVMPRNLFASEEDLYGYSVTPKIYAHVAPEFMVYRNYSVAVKPKTGDRILVYLYLQKVGINRILESFADESCAGVSC